ncbi:MAG: T9SS type A sorting domain-containing protein, partial [Bacteroidia bacterium]
HLPGLTSDNWLWKLDENGCDSTGCATVFTGIEVEEYDAADENIVVYPNPFKGSSITLILPIMPQDGKIDVTFYNNLGQQAMTTTAIATHPAHVIIYDNKLPGLSAGMYFVQLKTKRGMYSAKVLKE